MEVRGYPTLLFFSAEQQEGGAKAIKYKGQRTREALEEFALNGGYKTVSEEDEIPMNLSGLDAWARWLDQQKQLIVRDIDMAWQQYGLHDYVPAPYHYAVVVGVCSIPFILVCATLCCLGDEEDLYQAPPARVSPSKGGKTTSRREKLE